MKRFITIILSAIIAINTSAQNTPLDNVFKQIKQINDWYTPKRSIGNFGNGDLMISNTLNLHFMQVCAKSICGVTPVNGFESDSIAAEFDSKNKKDSEKILSLIRHNIDSLSTISESSYRTDLHTKETDSISYSLCFNCNGYSAEKAMETVSFHYETKQNLGCKIHKEGFGELKYGKIEPVGESKPFNLVDYMKTIMPELEKKGVKMRQFKWVYDDPKAIKSEDYMYTETLYMEDGEHTTGITYGTMYYLPRSKKAADWLLAIDSLTYNFVDARHDQIFTYYFDIPQEVLRPGCLGRINSMLNLNDTNILVACDEDNYYILVTHTKGVLCVPTKWSKLKSFVNGKKEYLK